VKNSDLSELIQQTVRTVTISQNISVSSYNDSKSKMGDRGREIKVTSFKMRAFPWLVSFDTGTNKLHRAENRWNDTKKNFRVTLTQDTIAGRANNFCKAFNNPYANTGMFIKIWHA